MQKSLLILIEWYLRPFYQYVCVFILSSAWKHQNHSWFIQFMIYHPATGAWYLSVLPWQPFFNKMPISLLIFTKCWLFFLLIKIWLPWHHDTIIFGLGIPKNIGIHASIMLLCLLVSDIYSHSSISRIYQKKSLDTMEMAT